MYSVYIRIRKTVCKAQDPKILILPGRAACFLLTMILQILGLMALAPKPTGCAGGWSLWGCLGYRDPCELMSGLGELQSLSTLLTHLERKDFHSSYYTDLWGLAS